MSQPAQQQQVPGLQSEMDPVPDCGEKTYQGTGKLKDKVALITGADSGIGRAAAIAFAREGADVAVHFHSSEEDARTTASLVEEAGRTAVVLQADISDERACADLVSQAVEGLGSLDLLVMVAGAQRTVDS